MSHGGVLGFCSSLFHDTIQLWGLVFFLVAVTERSGDFKAHDKKSYGHGSTSFIEEKNIRHIERVWRVVFLALWGKGGFSQPGCSRWFAGCGAILGEFPEWAWQRHLRFCCLGICRTLGIFGFGRSWFIVGFNWLRCIIGGCHARPTSVLDWVSIGFASWIWSVRRNTVPGSLEDISHIFYGLVLVWQSIGK